MKILPALNNHISCQNLEIQPKNYYQLIQDLFIRQSNRTDLQAKIGTDSQEYNIIEDDLH